MLTAKLTDRSILRAEWVAAQLSRAVAASGALLEPLQMVAHPAHAPAARIVAARDAEVASSTRADELWERMLEARGLSRFK
jgi:hypothetical protein